jgi:hypothetical protein
MHPTCVPETVNVTAFEVPHCVVTVTDPVQLFVGTVIVIAVLLHEVVGTVTPFSETDPDVVRKFCPMIVTCALGEAGDGATLVIVGSGMLTVTVAAADFVVSAWLVAVTLTVCCFMMLAGAVYRPEALIEPVPEGLIVQLTAVFEVFATLAANCCVWPG